MKSFAVTMMVAAACMSAYFIPCTLADEKCFACAVANIASCGTKPAAGEIACASKNCYEVHVQDASKVYAGTLRGCSTNATDTNCNGALTDDSYSFMEGKCKHCPATAADFCNKNMYTAPAIPPPAPGGSGSGNGTGPGNGSGSGNGTGPGNGTALASGHPPSITGSVMLCAFMSSLALAGMFYNTAV